MYRELDYLSFGITSLDNDFIELSIDSSVVLYVESLKAYKIFGSQMINNDVEIYLPIPNLHVPAYRQ